MRHERRRGERKRERERAPAWEDECEKRQIMQDWPLFSYYVVVACSVSLCARVRAHARSLLLLVFFSLLWQVYLPGGYFGAPLRAVVPTIRGRAWIAQHCQVVVDPSDPFPQGYTVGDIWAE